MIPQLEKLRQACDQHDRPLVFATVSGAHLYGFASADSDFDLRGAHVNRLEESLGLFSTPDTIEKSDHSQGFELDLVTHDIAKFFKLMLRPNGYVLEQLFSPLVVHTSQSHQELMQLGRDCITRHHFHHYKGFAANQWQFLSKQTPARVKPLLYTFRVLLTGIHLMQTGEIEANLVQLNRKFSLSYIDELIRRKTYGQEQESLDDSEGRRFESEYERLQQQLENEFDRTSLPDVPVAKADLNDLLVRLRMSNA